MQNNENVNKNKSDKVNLKKENGTPNCKKGIKPSISKKYINAPLQTREVSVFILELLFNTFK